MAKRGRKPNPKKINIKTVYYNNKSRKGLYYRVKSNVGKVSVIKVGKGVPEGILKSYYHDRYTNQNKKATITGHKKMWKGLPLLERKKKGTRIIRPKIKVTEGRLSKIIGKGIKTTEIQNILQTNEPQIKVKLKELLRPVVEDEQLLNLLTSEVNMVKIANRIECLAILQDNKGIQLAEVGTIGKKTPRKVIQELNKMLTQGQIIDGYNQTAQTIKEKNYMYSHMNDGTIDKIKLQITFRKTR